ncbi:MAG: DUF512 domain-containing protein [Nitrospirae bacterium]|jgi:putative radical SAM enzyme (TIGR03279 family)|nr:DUF512 domain-containing protein [Nitrospirota bacterium]
MAQGLTIKEILPGSLAEEAGIPAGHNILSINGNPLRDLIDLEFYQAEGELIVQIENPAGERRELFLEKDPDERLGIVLDPPPIRRCPNDCDFCFVDQMPTGQRQSLYIRDEDYRYSFLYGNFITLTNLSEKDYRRILEQRLSPLYISVHATDPVIRRRLLRNERAPDILDRIDHLIEGGIRLHTQIVITPGINDGEVLDRSVEELSARFPGVSSLAIVPVGLTGHREGLPSIRSIDKEFARQMLGVIETYQKPFMKKWDDPFVFPADEWYVIAEKTFPSLRRYGSLPQLGNGVGMVPLFYSDWKKKLLSFRKKGFFSIGAERTDSPWVMVTGTAFSPYLEKLLSDLGQVLAPGNGSIESIRVENRLFGPSVTVAGLLAGEDIASAVMKANFPPGTRILVPDVALRADSDILIDDMSLRDISRKTGFPVMSVPSDARGFWEWMESFEVSQSKGDTESFRVVVS